MGPRGQTLRVVLAEDEPLIADILRNMLEREGHEVIPATDGERALELIAAEPDRVDVLITDQHMPRLSGLGLVSKLRDTAFSGVIVVHSSSLTNAERDAFNALAVDHFLSKPVKAAVWQTLVRSIAECIASRRA